MKIFENMDVTSSIEVDIPVSKEPIAEYILRLTQALRSEEEAIREYQAILNLNSLPANVKNALTEIIEDEKDHLMSLTTILELEMGKALPDNGDIDPETGNELIPDLEEDKTKTEASKLKRKKITKKDEESTLTEGIESKQISIDGTNNTKTYKIVADVDYDLDNLIQGGAKIEDRIIQVSKDTGIQLEYVSLGGNNDQLVYKAIVKDDQEFDEHHITKLILSNINNLVWLR